MSPDDGREGRRELVSGGFEICVGFWPRALVRLARDVIAKRLKVEMDLRRSRTGH